MTFEDVKFDGPNPSNWRRVLKLWALRHKQNLERHKWLIFLPASQRQYGPEGTRLIEWCLEKLEDSGIGLREGTRYSETIYTFTLGFGKSRESESIGEKGENIRAGPIPAARARSGQVPAGGRSVENGHRAGKR